MLLQVRYDEKEGSTLAMLCQTNLNSKSTQQNVNVSTTNWVKNYGTDDQIGRCVYWNKYGSSYYQKGHLIIDDL